MENKTAFYPCSCGCSILTMNMDIDKDWPWVNVAVWIEAGHSWSWKSRIRMAWYLLRHGAPFGDDILLDRETTRRLAADLSAICWAKISMGTKEETE